MNDRLGCTETMKIYFQSFLVIIPAFAVASFMVPVFPSIPYLGFGHFPP